MVNKGPEKYDLCTPPQIFPVTVLLQIGHKYHLGEKKFAL